MNRGLSWLTTLLAFILVLECGGLTYSLYQKVQLETEPERLVDRVERLLVEHYPQMKQRWLDNAERQTPLLAQDLSHSLIERLPGLREELESLTLNQLERGIDNAVELSADEFRQWLRENHSAIEDIFLQVERAPSDTRLLVLDTEASLEEQLGVDLQDQAKLTLEFYKIFNDRLERLADPQAELTRQERLERRTIRIVRALTVSAPDARDAAYK